MKKIFTIIVLISVITAAAIFLKTYNNSAVSQTDNQKIPVVASFYPISFFAQAIGGDKVQVTTITPSGAEPHDYEPTTADIQKISESKLLLVNGLGLESWGSKIENKNMVTVSDDLHTKLLVTGTQQTVDPHIWLSPVLSREMVNTITHALSSISPENSRYFETNQNSLLSQLNKLDGSFRSGLSSCSKHDIVTSHAAFGYLARDYGFNQIAIAGLSPDEEPTSQKLTEITNLVRQKNISYIFFESLVSPRLAQTIAQETGSKTLVFNPLEGLTSNEIRNGANYFSIQMDNLANLRTALSCM